jgi:hypothetical protein
MHMHMCNQEPSLRAASPVTSLAGRDGAMAVPRSYPPLAFSFFTSAISAGTAVSQVATRP